MNLESFEVGFNIPAKVGMDINEIQTPSLIIDFKIFENNIIKMKEFVINFRREFEHMTPEQIGFPRSINNVEKYSDTTSIYKKGTPMHVKGALLYNHLLKNKKVAHKYQRIYEGDKGKFVHLRKNMWNANVITFMADLPKEFDMHKLIDYDLQFNKSFMEPLRFILEAIKWRVDASETSNLEDFF